MRATASSLLIMTGHFADANDRPLPDLRSLLASGTTIALYMPGPDARITASKLAAAGLSLQTPIALVSRASTAAQQMTLTTLQQLPQITMQAKPSILIVGDVVRLSQHDRFRLEALYGQPLPLPAPTHRKERDVWDTLQAVNHG
jgi:uroporphyrin-III C-methyltransferase/precorrin-2 dehydrogenase/sirohydrochlorin ferrochelatase